MQDHTLGMNVNFVVSRACQTNCDKRNICQSFIYNIYIRFENMKLLIYVRQFNSCNISMQDVFLLERVTGNTSV